MTALRMRRRLFFIIRVFGVKKVKKYYTEGHREKTQWKTEGI
jgi:hypothetical protein